MSTADELDLEAETQRKGLNTSRLTRHIDRQIKSVDYYVFTLTVCAMTWQNGFI